MGSHRRSAMVYETGMGHVEVQTSRRIGSNSTMRGRSRFASDAHSGALPYSSKDKQKKSKQGFGNEAVCCGIAIGLTVGMIFCLRLASGGGSVPVESTVPAAADQPFGD